MNYLDVYWSRLNHLGETTAERIRNSNIRSFEKWLDESPFTLNNLSVERGLYFRGIAIRSKDKEYEKIMFLHVANDITVRVGDILNWPLEDGTIEKWILIQEEKKVNPPYRTFWIVRCNYLMKWIDDNGHLQQCWSYFVSSLDSKIKGNFRTWSNLITPQPNKYAEILMPKRAISRSTNFIVEEESWSVVEYDHTSVPGVIYLSLTENKINKIYDDVENNIADLDKRAKYQIITPPTIQHFKVGDTIENLIFTITKNGIPFSPEKVEYVSSNKKIAHIENGKLTATSNGEVDIVLNIPEYKDIQPNTLSIKIAVDDEDTSMSYYIEGPEIIRLDREAQYTVRAINGLSIEADSFSIDKPEYATVTYLEEENIYNIRANKKNILGDFIFTVKIGEAEVTKKISVIPLW